MCRPWLRLIVLLAAGCSVIAESTPPPSDGSYQVRLRDLEARVEALKDENSRKRYAPSLLRMPAEGVDAALDEELQRDAGVE